ncbi:MAG TPA: DUF2157 domain-containing protein [Steroidobacter sp.]|uniref:DUF2157 domain-containing protein n=1 Tax=Steroidobacter sp. TaxID=1978227 RepID=UPI002ED778B7
MSNLSKAEAQLRADHIRVFREELARLEGSGVLELSATQRDAINQHHDDLLASYAQAFDIDRNRHAKQLSLGMRIASFLGALALAASVFFLFNQYWGLFPTAAQLALMIVASLGSLGATFWVGRRDGSGYFARLVAMVSFACFVLNVSLLGGMFNITPSDKAFVVWGAFGLLLAYRFDLRLLLAAAIVCLIAFVAARVGTWSGMYWIHFGERPENFFPAGILLFLVPLLIRHDRFTGFASIYRVFGLLTLLLPILVLANWGRSSYLPFSFATIEYLYQVLGFVLSAAAIWWGARHEHSEVVNTGTTFFVIFLYTKFYDWWWEIVPKFVFFLIIALTAILFILVMKRLRAGALASGGGQ